jgi:hypothetical protein
MTRTPVIHPDCDIRLLVFAVVEDAKRCAARGDRKARKWLMTEGAAWMDVLTNIHPDKFKRVMRGKPLRPAQNSDPRRWDKYKPGQAIAAR